MEAVIEVNNLVKEYVIAKKESGLRGALKSLLFPEKTKVKGVDGISFSIAPGEIVGYIGPNGAGKSTTIKMLTGIFHPTSGSIKVCGISPQADRKGRAQAWRCIRPAYSALLGFAAWRIVRALKAHLPNR